MTTPEPVNDEHPEYGVYAIKYAEADALPSDKLAIGAAAHDTPARDMTYYVWLFRRAELAIVVDTGFNAGSGARRGHRLLRSPVDGLRALGFDLETVRTLVVTSLPLQVGLMAS